MKLTIASAPDSWGVWFSSDPKQTPWNRFMDEVVEAGYEWIELGPPGYLPADYPTLKKELDKRNLKVTGTYAMGPLETPEAWPAMEKMVRDAGEILVKFGAKWLVLIDDIYTDLFTGAPLAPGRLDPDSWKRLIDASNRVGEIAGRDYGLTVVFHPHAETHIEYEDQIERLLNETDPKLVQLCLDLGHHAYRGGDPVAFMRKHHTRIPYLHLKSVYRDKQKTVERENIPFALAVADDLFCEPAEGAVDFPAFRDLLKEINFEGFGVVEQDMYPAPFDKPLPIAKRTRKYLREIGLG